MAQSNESKLWNRIKKLGEKSYYTHFTRIESNTVNGIPDVHCLVNKQLFWLELKANDLKNRGLSKWQINWHIKYQIAGGKVFILNSPLKERALEILAVSRDSRSTRLVYKTDDTSNTGLWSCILQAASAEA